MLIVESFVDPEQFSGTVYTSDNWQELGHTDGWGRCGRDYYVKHDRPKRLFVRQLHRNARRSLDAEHVNAGPWAFVAIVVTRNVPLQANRHFVVSQWLGAKRQAWGIENFAFVKAKLGF